MSPEAVTTTLSGQAGSPRVSRSACRREDLTIRRGLSRRKVVAPIPLCRSWRPPPEASALSLLRGAGVFGGFDEHVEGGAQVGVGVDDVGAGTVVVALPFG